MTEPQYVDLLDRATSGLPVPPDLVAGGIVAGRRRRRRHLAGTACLAAVVVGLAGTGLTLALSGGAPTEVQVADPGPTATAPAATTATSPPAAHPRAFGPDPAQMAQVLGSLLPGTVTVPRNWSEKPATPNGFQAGSVLLDGAQVTVLLEHATLARCGEQPPGAACDSVGNGLASTSLGDEPASGGGTTGVRTATATLYTPDHFAITITAYNAAAEKGAEPILDQPVLTEAELLAIAQDPVWLR